MPLKLWTEEEDRVLKNKYYEFGTLLTNELNRNRKSIINRAHKIGIKTRTSKKVRFCLRCKKEINPYSSNKYNLCRSCSSIKRYNRKGAFSHNNSKLWGNEEVEYLIKNYYGVRKDIIILNLNRGWSSIQHKANRLGLERSPFFMSEGNKKGREYFKYNNPMLNPEFKTKALKKQAVIFSRSSMTSIEKKVSKFLDKIGISYDFNKCVKTKNTFRFPDFTIDKLIIECDGEYWHKNRKQEDYERQLELEELGYRVIRFTDREIKNNWRFVTSCILLELNL